MEEAISLDGGEGRAVFLNATCTSAGGDDLGALAVNHISRWNDLVLVDIKWQASLGGWKICRRTGIAGFPEDRTCFGDGTSRCQNS